MNARLTGTRKLLDVAAGIAGSFVSRNNDLDGYWSLGALRSCADSKHLQTLRLDILSGRAEPEHESLVRVAEAYRQVLARQLATRSIAHEVMVSAEVEITFYRDLRNAPSAATYGSPFSCTVRLTDHRDRTFERTIVGHCAPHDPRRERRSTRAEE